MSRTPIAVFIALAALMIGSSGCRGPVRQRKHTERAEFAEDRAGTPLEKGSAQLSRALDDLEQGYDNALSRRRRIAAFNRAIDLLKKANLTFLDARAEASEAEKAVIQERLADIDRYLHQAYKDRPVELQ